MKGVKRLPGSSRGEHDSLPYAMITTVSHEKQSCGPHQQQSYQWYLSYASMRKPQRGTPQGVALPAKQSRYEEAFYAS